LATLHLKKHGNDVKKSLAAVPAARSTREGLVSIGEPAIEASLINVGSAATGTDGDPEETANSRDEAQERRIPIHALWPGVDVERLDLTMG
jgi:hypothetical protein